MVQLAQRFLLLAVWRLLHDLLSHGRPGMAVSLQAAVWQFQISILKKMV
jgi:hypothetical protein